MLRRLALGTLLACTARGDAASVTPRDEAPPAAPIARASETAARERSTPSRPLVVDELGWARSEDPDVPLVMLADVDHEGESGKRSVDALLGAMDPILACWETAKRVEIVQLHVRVLGPEVHESIPVRVESTPRDDALGGCVDRAIRATTPQPERSQQARAVFRLFPRRDAATLRTVDPDAIVSVREAGTCWQWEDYPCAPNKHCMASQWVRTRCGEPTMRDDVRVCHGVTRPDIASPVTDVRLVSGDGKVLWLTPLPADVAQRMGERTGDPGSGCLDAARQVDAIAIDYGIATILVADRSGVRVLDRRSGALRLAWVSPEHADPAIFFDSAEWTLRVKKKTCRGHSNRGHVFARCDGKVAVFDGHALAVVDEKAAKLLGSVVLGDRGTKHSSKDLEPRATLSTGGATLSVVGRVFVE